MTDLKSYLLDQWCFLIFFFFNSPDFFYFAAQHKGLQNNFNISIEIIGSYSKKE